MDGKETTLTRASIEQDHAQLFAAMQTEFMQAGAQAERQRIADVRAQSLPGHEALIEKLAMDGKTTPEQAAMAVTAAEREKLLAAANAHFDDAPKAAAASAVGEKEGAMDAKSAIDAIMKAGV